jgi:dephospho-CoA kinase
VWKHGPTPVIGLVGAIGAGKSTVAARLVATGAYLLDADRIGHALLDQSPARRRVVERFGAAVLDPADPERIDRAALGRIVFADPNALRDLERILHPPMRRAMEKAIARVSRRRAAKAIVIDAAILFEAGWSELCDLVVFVDAPAELCRQRVARSRAWTGVERTLREAAQWPVDRKRASADYVLRNDADDAHLAGEIARLWSGLAARRRAASIRPAPAARARKPHPSGSSIKPKVDI